MKKHLLNLTVLIFFLIGNACGQKRIYTTSNAHSHNDYQNKLPFTTASNAQFGSIEADIFLWHDSLIVGHTEKDIPLKRTLENLYLEPLVKQLKNYNGHPYADSTLELQLLIDIKTEALPTLSKLVSVLKKYPDLIRSNKIHFVISGNRPDPAAFTSYPGFIEFDGEFQKNYSPQALSKLALFSDNLKKYTSWNGEGPMPVEGRQQVDSLVRKAHSFNKKLRFWNAPDFPNAWRELMSANVDYLNTDKIDELSSFFSSVR